jgi:hypothetical protein
LQIAARVAEALCDFGQWQPLDLIALVHAMIGDNHG